MDGRHCTIVVDNGQFPRYNTFPLALQFYEFIVGVEIYSAIEPLLSFPALLVYNCTSALLKDITTFGGVPLSFYSNCFGF